MEPYVLKRGAFKNLTLRLASDGSLKVSAPWFLPRPFIDAFVRDRTAWIAEKRRSLPLEPVVRTLPETVHLWGVPHRVRIQAPGKLPRVWADAGAGEVVLRVPAAWSPAQILRVWELYEKNAVEAALNRLVPLWCGRMDLKVEKWTVKRLRSRWGSCRPDTRSLVFNSRLAAMPLECLEHVVVHELVHLIEASHNARFHALVEHWLPGSDAVRKLLKRGSAGSDAFADPRATTGAETAP